MITHVHLLSEDSSSPSLFFFVLFCFVLFNFTFPQFSSPNNINNKKNNSSPRQEKSRVQRHMKRRIEKQSRIPYNTRTLHYIRAVSSGLNACLVITFKRAASNQQTIMHHVLAQIQHSFFSLNSKSFIFFYFFKERNCWTGRKVITVNLMMWCIKPISLHVRTYTAE